MEDKAGQIMEICGGQSYFVARHLALTEYRAKPNENVFENRIKAKGIQVEEI